MRAAPALSPYFEFFLQGVVACLSSRFQRLNYLASYWNSEMLLYAQPDSGAPLPEIVADAVRRLHDSAFQEWISLGLSAQFSDLVEYLSTFRGEDRDVVLRVLGSPTTHNTFIPLNARLEEKALFSSDLTLLAELLKLHPFQGPPTQ